MTILGKIFAILVFLMSLVWFGLTVNLYATRAEWKKAYTAARSEAEKNAKDTEELKKQLILERQTIDARQQAASRAYIAQLGQAGSYRAPIVTQLVSGQRFYPAESYHQNYMTNYPQAAYIRYYDAPKLAALDAIADLEPVDRGVYCGAVGWVDAGRRRGALNVAIRTFWLDEGRLHFGTGGGITWDSDPDGEWAETELKADRLVALASRHPVGARATLPP